MKLENKNIMERERIAATSTFINKKLRSKRPRRRRSQVIAPSVLQNQTIFLDLSAHSSACSNRFDANEVSCDSTGVSIPKKRKFDEIEVVSESSFVDSNSGADSRLYCQRNSKLKKTNGNLKEIEGSDAVSVTQSDISCIELIPDEISKFSSEFKENDNVSFTSGFTVGEDNSNDVVDANFTASNSISGLDSSHLVCNEQLPLEDIVSDYSSIHSTVFSELHSLFSPRSSDSDYTPLFYDFGSQTSDEQKSADDSRTSLTYSIFLDFKQQFSRSASPLLDPEFASRSQHERQLFPTCDLKTVRFEEEEYEESYVRLRERERRQVFLRDYTEEYQFTTDYADLILQQRSFMIRWIVEQSTAKKFQQETIFLGVSLFDRFLTKGFFKTRRSLQIVGIACLTLAIRIEENQPYNSIRQRTFYIGSNTYSRNEVVAMERLVMEVLNFQCFLPTIYNFMWFYLKAAKANTKVENRAKYLAVLALSDHEQLRYWPSTVAAGIVIMASMDAGQHGSYHQVIEIHMRTKDNDLPECMTSLDWLVQYIR